MIISSRNVCTLICLGCAQLLLAPPCHMCELSLSTCNRSLNIFALFPFGFCKTSALQSCRNFPYTTAPCNPTTCYISCSCSWSILQRKLLLAMAAGKKEKRATARNNTDIGLLTVNAIVSHHHHPLKPGPRRLWGCPSTQNSRTKLVNQFLSAQRHAKLPTPGGKVVGSSGGNALGHVWQSQSPRHRQSAGHLLVQPKATVVLCSLHLSKVS